jgi:hypothetical protein
MLSLLLLLLSSAACCVCSHRCEDLLALRSKLSGLSVLSSSSEEVVLGICLKLPTARQQGVDAAAAGAQGMGCCVCTAKGAHAVVGPGPAAKLLECR